MNSRVELDTEDIKRDTAFYLREIVANAEPSSMPLGLKETIEDDEAMSIILEKATTEINDEHIQDMVASGIAVVILRQFTELLKKNPINKDFEKSGE